jgi:uncharacterized protein YcfJ
MIISFTRLKRCNSILPILTFCISVFLLSSCKNEEQKSAQSEEDVQVVTSKESTPKRTSQTKRVVGETEELMKNKEVKNVTKGAVVGGVAGAVTGALVSKEKPVKGALVGGAIGAGAGALTGAAIDKKQKDGKIFKKGLFKKNKNKTTENEN